MTEAAGKPGADAIAIVREVVRRSGHEIRNALNGVSVNVEVVKSRKGREGAAGEVASFADRASTDVGRATSFTNGVLALFDAVLTAASKGTLKASRHGDASEIELMIYGDRGPVFMSDIAPLAEVVNMRVEQKGQSVILRVLPEDKSHSKT